MKTRHFLFAAAFAAAIFTFSCSDDGGGNNNTSTCGDKDYNAAIYTCDKGELVGFCRGNSYYPEYQYCDSNGEIKEGTEISSSSLSSVGSSSSSVGGGQSSGSSSSVGGQGGGSSSSVGGVQSSSSSSSVGGQGGGSCVDFVEGTEREHYGKMKKQFCDERDGQKYVYVIIGEGETAQTWMAENLNYNADGSKCYDNNPDNCVTYGRLYDGEPAKVACPSGWHLPSQAELAVLLGNDAKKLKATSFSGTDDYGFCALPGGQGLSYGGFSSVGDFGYWWNANNSGYAFGQDVYYDFVDDYLGLSVWALFSVRCLQD